LSVDWTREVRLKLALGRRLAVALPERHMTTTIRQAGS
jgi:hypothetical protein